MKKLLLHWQVWQRIVLLGLVVFSVTALADNGSSGHGIDLPHRSNQVMFSARIGHQVVSFDDGSGEKLWLIGGQDSDEKLLNDIWTSDDGINWSQVKVQEPYFSPRSFHSVVVFNNQLWVIGDALDSSSSLNDVWSSPNGINWTEHPIGQFPPRVGYQVAVLSDGSGDTLWLLGGLEDITAEARVEIWSSTDGDTWTDAGNLPVGQIVPQVVSFDSGDGQGSMLWLLGTDRTADPAIWTSNDGITWTKVRINIAENRELPYFPNGGHQAVVFNEELWLIGGAGNVGEGNRLVWASTNGSDWEADSREAPFGMLLHHQAVVFHNQLFVIGGMNVWEDNPIVLNDIWKTTDGQTWTKLR